ncbi:MAG: glycosyltransferase family 39 protein, partial [Anaerolineales bacterium]|nr:glycosyltransferase family 39 protein [Anaerolineales bacterium]
VGITAVFLLTRKLLPRAVAAVSVLLMAFEPFLVGLSGLLHVDALLTTFATISLLALGVALVAEMPLRRRGVYTAVSGIMAALALLTKSPALLLLPLSLAFISLKWWPAWRVDIRGRWRTLFALFGAWLLAFIVTLFAIFPALWTSPTQVAHLMSSNANRHIEEALRPTYFLGNITFDHGPVFYPVALAYRFSPALLLGIILSFWLIARYWRRNRISNLRELVKDNQLFWVLLASWSLLFVVGISPATKKFDRYALPIFPSVILLAAVAWYRMTSRQWRGLRLGLLIALLLQLGYFFVFMPYPLSAYNWLVGGPGQAQRVMPLGWGDDIGAAARWLAAQPDSAEKTAVSTIAPALAPLFPGETLLPSEDSWRQADYLIVTAGNRQGNEAGVARWIANANLVHTVRFGGLEQAWVYERPFPQPRPAPIPLREPVSYGGRVRLASSTATVSEERVALQLRWGLLPGGENFRYTVKISVLDENGQTWTTYETPLLNDVYFYPEHWLPAEMTDVPYAIELPLAMPAAAYQVAVELFDAETNAQMPVATENGRFAGVRYVVGEIAVSPPETVLDSARLAIGHPTDLLWSDAGLRLLGHEPLLDTIVNGAVLPLDLYWQAARPTAADWQIAVQIGPKMVTLPVSRWPVTAWRSGEVVHEKYGIPVPISLTDGDYPVTLGLVDGAGALVGETAVLGIVTVNALDRLFVLPDDIETSLAYRFGENVQLAGVDMDAKRLAAGEPVQLTLYWQVLQKPPLLINVFVHLVGPDGDIVAQDDRWPGGLPTDLWAAGQVIVDE